MDVEGAAVTTALMVHLDREAVVLPSGERSTMRRFEAPAGEALPQLLVRCGVPLQFLDGRGLWLVFAGRADAAGDLLAVVRQIPGKDSHGSGAEVLFAVDRAPAELAVGSDLYLFYRSTSGPEDDVVAAAAQGRAWQPAPAPLVDNAAVRQAVAAFSAEPGQGTMVDVLRQAMGGQLLVDVTGSDAASPRVHVEEGPEGVPALAAFTRQEELGRLHQERGDVAADQVSSLALPGLAVLRMMLQNAELGWLYVDPAGPTCALARPDVEFAVQGAPNTAVKDALAGTPSQQQLFTALAGSEALFLGDRVEQGRTVPATIPATETEPTVRLAVFTSAAEVAAYDPSLSVRQFGVGFVLNLAFRQRLGGIVINPAGPSAGISSFQIWHILGNPALEG